MPRRALAALIFGLLGTAVLVSLGTWQLQRLAWKEGVIADLEARFAAPPVPVPSDPDPATDAFLRVTLTGTPGDREVRVLTTRKPEGPGYRIIVPVVTDGRRIMADLGYVPERLADPADRPLPETLTVTGALYWPEEVDGFTPEPDLGRNIWFARDLEPMAEALNADPLLVIAESHDAGDWPYPLRLGINLPNDHLEYAITWFSLALIWAVMSLFLVRRESHR